MGQGWGDPGCKAMAVQGRAGKAPKGPLMTPQTKSPREGGLTLPGKGITLVLRTGVMEV